MANRKHKTANLPRPKKAPPAPTRGRSAAARQRQRTRESQWPSLAVPAWAGHSGPVALAVLVLVGAVLRGLYFRADQLYVGIAVLGIGAIALVWHRWQRQDQWEISFADVAVFGLLLFSWLSLLWAAERRLALDQAIVYTMAIGVYLYARSRGEGGVAPALLWGLGGVALASWLMAGGLWNYPAAVTVVDRLSGPFQYPDTAGAVYLATWLGTLAAQDLSARRGGRIVWSALGGLAAYLFALSLSRGTWVIAPLAVLALVGTQKPGRRIAVFAQMAIVGLLSFALAAKTLPHFNNVGSHYALLYGAASIVLSLAIGEGIAWVHSRRLDRWQGALGALLVLLVLTGGALAYRSRGGIALTGGQVTVGLQLPQGRDRLQLQVSGSGSAQAQIVSLDRFGTQTVASQSPLHSGTQELTVTVPKGSTSTRLLVQGQGNLHLERVTVNGKPASLLLARAVPQSIYHKLLGISGTDLSVWERIDFWHDGLKMFARSPVIGWGGNAWQAIYLGFQSFAYNSKQAHSSVVDAGVSYGIFGILLSLAMAGAFALGAVRSWGKGSWGAVALVTGAAIWLHSLIDFDFSLPAVLLMVWAGLGSMPQVRLFRARSPGNSTPQVMGVLVGAVAVWVLVLSFAAGAEAGQQKPTLAGLKQAESLDPWSARLHLQVAEMELQQAGSSKAAGANALRQSAVQEARAAYGLDPHNQFAASLEAQMQIDQGNQEAALATLGLAQRDAPMNPNTYQNYIEVATSLATRALDAGHKQQAQLDIKKGWAMYETFQREGQETAKVAPQNLQLPPATPQLQLYAGEAAALNGRPEAVPLLRAALAAKQQSANLWLAALGKSPLPASQYAQESKWLQEASSARR